MKKGKESKSNKKKVVQKKRKREVTRKVIAIRVKIVIDAYSQTTGVGINYVQIILAIIFDLTRVSVIFRWI